MSSNSLQDLIPHTGFCALLYPLIRLQTQIQTQVAYSTLNSQLKFTNLREATSLSLKEGFAGIYRGVTFGTANAGIKGTVAYLYYKIFSNSPGVSSFLQGSLLNFIAAGVAYPLELLQVRSASAINSSNGNSLLKFSEHVNASTFTNIKNWHAFPLLFGKIMYLSGISYMLLSNWVTNPLIICGLAVGSVPFDVVRRNLMIGQWEGNTQIKSISDCTSLILKTQGYKGLFRGVLLYPELYLIGGTALVYHH